MDLANFEAGGPKKSKNRSKIDENRKIFEILKMVQISKLGCLVYSFDRKIGFFREKKFRNFPYWSGPEVAQCSGVDLANFEVGGPKKLENRSKIDENRKNQNFKNGPNIKTFALLPPLLPVSQLF